MLEGFVGVKTVKPDRQAVAGRHVDDVVEFLHHPHQGHLALLGRFSPGAGQQETFRQLHQADTGNGGQYGHDGQAGNHLDQGETG